jgi:glyoxylate reductase
MTEPRDRVFVTRALSGRALERLAEQADCEVWSGPGAPPAAALREHLSGCAGLLCLLTDRIDEGLLASAPSLRVISSCSVGVNHIDLEAASRRGLPVGYTPGVLVETTADLAFGLLLATARRIVEADGFVRSGAWTPERSWEPDMMLGRDVHGATLGLLGLGEIGRAVARRARGFGMRILGWTRSGRQVEGVETVDFDRVVSEADFLSVHVAAAPETHHLVDAAVLARMRPGAILVNTARGEVVDEAALVEVLTSRQLAAAGLDVFEREPLDPASALLGLPNVVLAPHIGSASIATRSLMADLAVDNLLAGLEGRPLPHCANADRFE